MAPPPPGLRLSPASHWARGDWVPGRVRPSGVGPRSLLGPLPAPRGPLHLLLSLLTDEFKCPIKEEIALTSGEWEVLARHGSKVPASLCNPPRPPRTRACTHTYAQTWACARFSCPADLACGSSLPSSALPPPALGTCCLPLAFSRSVEPQLSGEQCVGPSARGGIVLRPLALMGTRQDLPLTQSSPPGSSSTKFQM